jgi:hypothetical protein
MSSIPNGFRCLFQVCNEPRRRAEADRDVRAVAKERLAEISRALQRFSWMTDTMEQSTVGNSHPYVVAVYVAGLRCAFRLTG